VFTVIEIQSIVKHNTLLLHSNVLHVSAPKHVVHCCKALKCCVWLYTLFVFQFQYICYYYVKFTFDFDVPHYIWRRILVSRSGLWTWKSPDLYSGLRVVLRLELFNKQENISPRDQNPWPEGEILVRARARRSSSSASCWDIPSHSELRSQAWRPCSVHQAKNST